MPFKTVVYESYSMECTLLFISRNKPNRMVTKFFMIIAASLGTIKLKKNIINQFMDNLSFGIFKIL